MKHTLMKSQGFQSSHEYNRLSFLPCAVANPCKCVCLSHSYVRARHSKATQKGGAIWTQGVTPRFHICVCPLTQAMSMCMPTSKAVSRKSTHSIGNLRDFRFHFLLNLCRICGKKIRFCGGENVGYELCQEVYMEKTNNLTGCFL